MEKIYHPNTKRKLIRLYSSHTKKTSEQGKLSGIRRELHNDKGVNSPKSHNNAECMCSSKRVSKYMRQKLLDLGNRKSVRIKLN